MVEAELLPVLKHNYVCLFNGTVKTCYRYSTDTFELKNVHALTKNTSNTFVRF